MSSILPPSSAANSTGSIKKSASPNSSQTPYYSDINSVSSFCSTSLGPDMFSPNGSVSTMPMTTQEQRSAQDNVTAEPPPPSQNADVLKSGEEMEVIFMDGKLDPKYVCLACSGVLQTPMKFADCEHRCCSPCLDDWIKTNTICPVDQLDIDHQQLAPDSALQREIFMLPVLCSWSSQTDCPWTGILHELSSHLVACRHRLLSCPRPGCNRCLESALMEAHMANDCVRRELVCQFCEKAMVAIQEKPHLEHECPLFPIPCPNSCKKKEVPRRNMTKHLESQCGRQKITCQYAEFGCEVRTTRKKLRKHLTNDIIDHLLMLNNHLVGKRETLSKDLYSIALYTEVVEEFDLRVSALEMTHGPQLVWRIDRYAERLQEAKAGRKTSVFSPTFLTSRQGYRLAISLSLYGDGSARGNFMSVFVCICRGEQDALQRWPFSHRITLELLDQCESPQERRPIIYSLKPNICPENMPFLSRPKAERNASFGNQKWIPLAVMNTLDYVKDDNIFIKAVVDTTTLSAV